MPRTGTGKDIFARMTRQAIVASGLTLTLLAAAPALAQEASADPQELPPGETVVELGDAARISLPNGDSVYTSFDGGSLKVSGAVVRTRTNSKAQKTAITTRTDTLAPIAGGGPALISVSMTGQQQRPRLVMADEPRPRAVGGGWVPNPTGNGGTLMGGTVPVAGQFQVLPPGNGFSGPTAQPAAVGSAASPGYDAKAMARWDVVPFQTISSQFPIGVVAFHVNGIDRVEFSLNGGPWVAVHQMQLNPRTNVNEYTAIVDPSTMGDGVCEIRAIVWPNVGEPRVLAGAIPAGYNVGEHSMLLNSNGRGTLGSREVWVSPSGSDSSGDGSRGNPFATIAKAAYGLSGDFVSGNGDRNVDGGVINLLPGGYAIGTSSSSNSVNTQNRWMTIRPDPQVDAASVSLTSAGRFSAEHVKLENVRLIPSSPSGGYGNQFIKPDGNPYSYLWLDHCYADGRDRTIGVNWTDSAFTGRYWTGTTLRNCENGSAGAVVRDTLVDTITSDAFTGALLIVNSEARNINASGTGAHPDVLQFHGDNDYNVIAYGMMATDNIDAQGIFAGGSYVRRDYAFVNCHIDTSAGWGTCFAIGGTVNHLFAKNCVFDHGGSPRWMGVIERNFVLESNIIGATGQTFIVEASDDGAGFPGTLPWTSPLGVVYRSSVSP